MCVWQRRTVLNLCGGVALGSFLSVCFFICNHRKLPNFLRRHFERRTNLSWDTLHQELTLSCIKEKHLSETTAQTHRPLDFHVVKRTLHTLAAIFSSVCLLVCRPAVNPSKLDVDKLILWLWRLWYYLVTFPQATPRYPSVCWKRHCVCCFLCEARKFKRLCGVPMPAFKLWFLFFSPLASCRRPHSDVRNVAFVSSCAGTSWRDIAREASWHSQCSYLFFSQLFAIIARCATCI